MDHTLDRAVDLTVDRAVDRAVAFAVDRTVESLKLSNTLKSQTVDGKNPAMPPKSYPL